MTCRHNEASNSVALLSTFRNHAITGFLKNELENVTVIFNCGYGLTFSASAYWKTDPAVINECIRELKAELADKVGEIRKLQQLTERYGGKTAEEE